MVRHSVFTSLSFIFKMSNWVNSLKRLKKWKRSIFLPNFDFYISYHFFVNLSYQPNHFSSICEENPVRKKYLDDSLKNSWFMCWILKRFEKMTIKMSILWHNVFTFALWINLIIIIFQRRWDKVIYYYLYMFFWWFLML